MCVLVLHVQGKTSVQSESDSKSKHIHTSEIKKASIPCSWQKTLCSHHHFEIFQTILLKQTHASQSHVKMQ